MTANGRVGDMEDVMTFQIDRSDVAQLRRTAAAISDYADALEALESAIAGPMYECEKCDYESTTPQGIAAHGRTHKPAKKRRRNGNRHDWSDEEKDFLTDERYTDLDNRELIAAFRERFPKFSGSDKSILAQHYNLRGIAA